MKGKLNKILLLMLISILLMGCTNGVALGKDSTIDDYIHSIDLESINNYDIEIVLDAENKSYFGKQTITYINNTEETLDELYFHLYPNAYKSLETAPILFDRYSRNPSSYEEGYIDILEVSHSDTSLQHSIIGKDQTILKVELSESLEPREKIEIYLEYDGKLPSSGDRFGYGQRTMNFGNWYPIACVYDDFGWNLEPYYKLGDPFYSDVSNYNVRIITDQDIIVASSGNILSEDIVENKKNYEIEAKLIRDFAWVASKAFKVKEEELEGTRLKLYYLDENNAMIMHSINAGINSIKTFNKRFGKYPYNQYSIVMTEFPSGMEYPGIVFISNDYFIYNQRDMLEIVIVHETAHQWWYGIVGSNQVAEAWLDEGLATYSEYIYHKDVYGKSKGKDYLTRSILDGYEYGRRYLEEDTKVNKHLKDFAGWNDYGILVYTKGAMFFNEINKEYGEETLYKILKEYFNQYKFKNATTQDLIRICKEVTGEDLTELVDEWFK